MACAYDRRVSGRRGVTAPWGTVTAYLSGVRLLGRGLALYARSPGLLLLGIIPVLITALLFLVVLVALLIFLPDLAAAVTWFAADWSDSARQLVRLLAGIAILVLAFFLGVVTFTAVTLTIGDPFYERISSAVEQWCGGVTDEVEVGWWTSLRHSLGDSVRVVAITALVGVCLFAAGFLPLLGQTLVPVLAALVAGWFLAVELASVPFSRRGRRVRDRARALRRHRATALGFGSAVFLCFLIPGGAVLLMPAAVAGGTLLARRALGLPDTVRPIAENHKR